MYEMHYTGIGYPSMKEIEAEGKKRGFTHSYWATESLCYDGFYNGDTVVLYTTTDGMPDSMKRDAERCGKVIGGC